MTLLMNQSTQSSTARLARRTVRRASDATLELTGPVRVRPDFLIVGAQRCGTTTMFKTLVQHPAVVPALPAQGHPLLRQVATTGASTGTAGTSRWRPPRGCGGRGQRAITGESSPYYMFHPLARQRLAGDLPGVKLIVLLRDPVVRAYSGHSHEMARGFETWASRTPWPPSPSGSPASGNG